MAIARELARLAYPAETYRAMNMRSWEVASRHALAIDPASAALEKEYPGVGDAALNAARPTAQLGIERFVARMLERNAGIFAERLTASEMKAAANMYRAPVVRRILLSVLEGADLDPLSTRMANDSVATGTGSVDPAAIKRVEQTALAQTAAKLTADEHATMMRFQQTPWFPKLVAARNEIERRTLADVNAPDPAWIEKQQAMMREAMLGFITRSKPSAE